MSWVRGGTARRDRHDVVLFHHEGNVNGNPTLVAFLEMLVEAGQSVLLVTRQRPDVDQSVDPAVDVALYGGWRRGLVERIAQLRLPPQLEALAGRVAIGRQPEAAVVVSVDREGVLATSAWRAHALSGLLSFEIFHEDEVGRARKVSERQAASGLDFAAVQDPVRASDLREQTVPLGTEMILAPVAPRGSWPLDPAQSLRESLGVPPHHRLLLQVGSFGPWTGSEWLRASLGKLPEGWVVGVHERRGLVDFDGDPAWDSVLRSSSPVRSARDVPSLCVGAAAGLALYVEQDGNPWLRANIRHIGLASGKVANYLAAGVPVITNDSGYLGQMVRDHGVGVVVDDPSDLVRALDFIASEDGWEQRCRRFFEDHLDADRHLAPLVDRIRAAVATSEHGA